MRYFLARFTRLATVVSFVSVAACAADATSTVVGFTVGGTVTGLSGTLVLSDATAGTLTVTSDGTFTMPNRLTTGQPYAVSVSTQPSGETCTVNNSVGNVAAADVTSLNVVCTGGGFQITGIVDGLTGTALISDGSETVTVDGNMTSFSFPTAVLDGSTFSLTVLQPYPVGQTCNILNATGTIQHSSPPGIVLACQAALYKVSAYVSGYSTGPAPFPIVVKNNGTDSVSVQQDGGVTFQTQLPDLSLFDVTVESEPSSVACAVVNGYGRIPGADVTGILISCTSLQNVYTVGGGANGLSGSVVLTNQGLENLTVSANGPFAFPTPFANFGIYDVSIVSFPPNEACSLTTVVGSTFSNVTSGYVQAADVTSLALTCEPGFAVGGTIAGLTGTLRLQSATGEVLQITSPASTFRFNTLLTNQQAWSVAVLTQPSASETCTIAPYSGTISNSNVNNVAVSCGTTQNQPQYPVYANVTGLAANGNIKVTDGIDTLTVSTNAVARFPTPLAQNANYNIVVTQTNSPNQACTVNSPSGTVESQNVIVNVDCQAGSLVPINVSGLVGSVGVQTNGGAVAMVSQNGSLGVPPLVDTVTVLTLGVAVQPSHEQCVVRGYNDLSITHGFSVNVLCGAYYGFGTGQPSFAVLGETNFYTSNSNASVINANTLYNPSGDAWVDNSNTLYVSDFSHNRVLLYHGIPTTSGTSAAGVVGAASLTASGTTFSGPGSLGGDANYLAVADTGNNRVLLYQLPVATTGAQPALVVGQPSLSSTTAGCSASSLNRPSRAFIANGTLLIADTGNNRVLLYSSVPTTNGAAAMLAIGQPDLSSCAAVSANNVDATNMRGPADVWSDGASLLVLDTGNNRVLSYSSLPASSGVPADGEVGQNDFVSSSSSAGYFNNPTAMASNGGQLVVADTGNNRVAIYNLQVTFYGKVEPVPADVVLGQNDGSASTANAANGGTPSASTLYSPKGVAFSHGTLIVTDTGNSRISLFGGY